MKRSSLPLLLFPVLLALAACSTVAVTGRKQLNLISGQQIISLSATQYDEVLKTSKLSTNKAQTEMIKRVGGRIQGAVEAYMKSINRADLLAGFNWEYNLIQDDTTVNAWCMPGGKVAF
ncbi:MAG: M48 family peptidase, partial [Bacteroidota bacterium]